MLYIGDLSKQDSKVLSGYLSGATSFLEFGVGASTQIAAQFLSPGAVFNAIDTSSEWISTTEKFIREDLEINRPITFLNYDDKHKITEDKFDVIFVDGIKQKREEFTEWVWSHLKEGGYMLFHDGKREQEIDIVLRTLKRLIYEISEIKVNPNSSNIIVITKKKLDPYVNWNRTESKELWMRNLVKADRPANWKKILEDKLND